MRPKTVLMFRDQPASRMQLLYSGCVSSRQPEVSCVQHVSSGALKQEPRKPVGGLLSVLLVNELDKQKQVVSGLSRCHLNQVMTYITEPGQ